MELPSCYLLLCVRVIHLMCGGFLKVTFFCRSSSRFCVKDSWKMCRDLKQLFYKNSMYLNKLLASSKQPAAE